MARTTRRTVLQTAALSPLLAAPFVRGAYAAGKLSVGFWDHWVPGANAPLEKLCREWADKEKVDITVDFITSNGDKDLLTVAAEAQAQDRARHPAASSAWYAPGHAENLEPVDDVMAALIEQHGPVSRRRRISRQAGRPLGRGADRGTAAPCRRPARRIDLMKQFAGLDVTKMYPAGAPPDKELDRQVDLGFLLAGGREMPQGRLSRSACR